MSISAFPKLPGNLNRDLRAGAQVNLGYAFGGARMVSGGNYAAGGALIIVGAILAYRKLKKKQTQLLEMLKDAEAEAASLTVAFKGVDAIGVWSEQYCDVIEKRVAEVEMLKAELSEISETDREMGAMKLRFKVRVLKAEMEQYPND
jgi:hypothetical protein